MGALALVAALVLAVTPARIAADERETLVVRVFDTIGLPDGEAATMLRIAGDTLAPAGIRIRWKRCLDTALRHCAPQPGLDLIVRIVERHGTGGGGSCGFAMVEGDRGFVSLSQDCADRTVASLERKWTPLELEPLTGAEVLGYMLGHEIAHVLLPGSAHSSRGLFKARINARDWRMARRHGLRFSAVDIERLREAGAVLLAQRASTVPEREGPEDRPPDQVIEETHPSKGPRQQACARC